MRRSTHPHGTQPPEDGKLLADSFPSLYNSEQLLHIRSSAPANRPGSTSHGERMDIVSTQAQSDGMKRLEFLGAAAAAAPGGFARTKAPEPQPGADPAPPAKGDANPAKGAAEQLYNRHAPKRRKHDRELPDLSNLDGMKYQKAEA